MHSQQLTSQMLLGFSGESSSSSCEAGQAKEYMKNILKFASIHPVREISAKRLQELARELGKTAKKESAQ